MLSDNLISLSLVLFSSAFCGAPSLTEESCPKFSSFSALFTSLLRSYVPPGLHLGVTLGTVACPAERVLAVKETEAFTYQEPFLRGLKLSPRYLETLSAKICRML